MLRAQLRRGRRASPCVHLEDTYTACPLSNSATAYRDVFITTGEAILTPLSHTAHGVHYSSLRGYPFLGADRYITTWIHLHGIRQSTGIALNTLSSLGPRDYLENLVLGWRPSWGCCGFAVWTSLSGTQGYVGVLWPWDE